MKSRLIHFRPNRLTWFIVFSILGFIFVVALQINLSPYLKLTSNTLPTLPIFDTLLRLPGWLGTLAKFLLGNTSQLLGFILYLVIQVIQLIPIFIERDKNTIKKMLAMVDLTGKKVNYSENKTVRRLQKIDNLGAIWFKAHLDTLRLFSYLIDAAIAYYGYPFIASVEHVFDLGNLIEVIAYGRFNEIDLGALVKFLLTIYTIEALVKIYFALSDYRKIAKQ